jgi:hypothetical protein
VRQIARLFLSHTIATFVTTTNISALLVGEDIFRNTRAMKQPIIGRDGRRDREMRRLVVI